MAEGIVAPCPAAVGVAEGGAGGLHTIALPNSIHSIRVLRNRGGSNFVLFDVEGVAVGFPGVGDGVLRACDGSDEMAAVGGIGVLEGASGSGDVAEAPGVIEPVSNGVIEGGGGEGSEGEAIRAA